MTGSVASDTSSIQAAVRGRNLKDNVPLNGRSLPTGQIADADRFSLIVEIEGQGQPWIYSFIAFQH